MCNDYRRACFAFAVVVSLIGGCDKPTTPAPPPPPTPHATVIKPGTYQGDALSLTIDDKGAGSVSFADAIYPVAVQSNQGASAAGIFMVKDKQFNWSTTADGDKLVFKTADAEYHLTRVDDNADNPLAKNKRNVTPVAATSAPATQSVVTADASRQMKFTRLSIHDPGINNIEAFSFLIPSGWKSEGGIKWFSDYSILANLLMKITDPKTGAQIEFLPIQNFTYLSNPVVPMQRGQNYMGNIVWEPIESAAEIIQSFYINEFTPELKGLSPIKTESLDKIAQQVSRAYNGQSQARATRLRYQYQMNGKPWQEDIYLTAVYTPWQMGTLWSVTSCYAFRAPNEKLDELTPTMNTVVTSAHMNQDWFSGYMYVQKLFSDRMAQGIKNAADLSRRISQNNDEIRQMFADSYKQRNDSQDRINEQFSEYIRGVDTYNDPYDHHEVQLPSGYNDYWVNNKGEYLLSNQSGFDPNVGDTAGWRRMDRPARLR